MFMDMNYIDDIKEYEEWVTNFRSIVQEKGKYPDRLAHELDSYFIYKNLDIGYNDKVLEFGCGFSYPYIYFSKFCEEFILSDDFSWCKRDYAIKDKLDPNTVITEAKKHFNVKPMQFSATKIPFPDNYFDKVYSISVMEHIEKDSKAMDEVYRVLKPGGKFVFTTEVNIFIGMKYKPLYFLRVYSLSELLMLGKSANFKMVNVLDTTRLSPEIIEKMRGAIFAPDQLIHPYKHFISAGMVLKK